MTGGAYLLGVVEVGLFAAAIVYGACRLRMRLLPSWSGSAARVVEIVLALSIVVCLGQLLGAIALLSELPLLAGAGAVALGASRLDVPARDGERRGMPAPAPFPSRAAAIGIGIVTAAVVTVLWLPDTARMLDQGIWGFDSMWHHLPAAARFAQTGSVTGLHFYDPITTNWFFPSNTELLHAIGIALTGRDILSPLLNLGWLGVALLAAWAIGRPYGAAAVAVLAVAALLVSPTLIETQAGRAKADIASIGLLLAAAAILLNGATARNGRGGSRLPASLVAIAIAGLAAGLAMGARINAIPVVAVVGIGLVVLAGRGGRKATALAWFAPVLATGGFWYLRNLFAAGSPLPFVSLGVGPLSLPATERGVGREPGDPVADLIGDGAVWRDFFIPGLEFVFGDLWFVVVGLALTGMIGAMVARETPVRGVIGAATLIGVVAYLFTPYTAGGPGEGPTHFALNLRYVMPVLALGLALVATLSPLRRAVGGYLLAALAVAAAVAGAGLGAFLDDHYRDSALIASAALAVGLAIVVGLVRRAPRLSRLELGVYSSALAIVAAFAFWPVASDYLHDRYANVWPGLNVSASFRWASETTDSRIALAGTTAAYFQYGYYGRDLSNAVQYIGRHEPRGRFTSIETCAEWRAAVNRGDFDYLVTSPTLNPADIQDPDHAPEREWLGDDPAASLILDDGPLAVFELTGDLDPAACEEIGALPSGAPPIGEARSPP